MIVSDADFLSAFSKIDKVDLIFSVFKTTEIVITRAVYDELKESPVFDILMPYFTAPKNKIIVKEVSAEDIPRNLGEGERQSITLAKDQRAKLLMDDRKAGKIAENKGIQVIDIPAFLFFCKEKNILNIMQIKAIISDLKTKDFYELQKDIEKELIS
ncbi:hypothetical protein HYT57_03285 [Candidatus Woesearchaeota archaeon]|nr:hypothetical protein [Candidatus Woesearchaeota archaeon]